MNSWPLSSATPRAKSQPSRSTSSNGRQSQSSSGSGGLDVEVPVAEDRRRAFRVGRGADLADRRAAAPPRARARPGRPRARTLLRDPGRGRRDVVAVGGIGADGRDRDELRELGDERVVRREVHGRESSREETRRAAAAAQRRTGLRYVADVVRLGERTQLLQALVLDLADPLARDVERARRPRRASAAAGRRARSGARARAARAGRASRGSSGSAVAAQRHLGRLVGQRRRLVGEEVTELGLVVVTDRLLERDGGLRAAADLLDLLDGYVEVARDLVVVGSRPSSPRSLRSER